MGIEAKFSQADVRKRTDKFLEVVEKRQINRFQYLGEMCVKHAREIPAGPGFTDQTGNLRSSIGYVIFKNGVAIHSVFEQVKEGAEGVKMGQMLAEKVGAKYKQGICLVVTAGMNYAIYVEATGRDVLTSAEILAKRELPKMIEELKSNIKKAMT
ncbi:hypothetical protein JZU61_04255 [bacterium]|nr:hypothetical protein [bacterium]